MTAEKSRGTKRLDIQPYAFRALAFAFREIGRYSGTTIKHTHFWQLIVLAEDSGMSRLLEL
jgi:hypothetical protein